MERLTSFWLLLTRLYAVERACREKGQTLWLTATPPEEIAARARRRQVAVIYLPARHHGRPLPLPQIIREPRLKWPASGYLPRQLQATIEMVLQQKIQLLLFVPAVSMVDAVVAGLSRDWPRPEPAKDWVRGCYAAHPSKEETIAAFYRGEFPVLVTTTVMERGITIARVAVMVLYADEERIFSTNTLVQVAGRAGRTTDYPDGQVFFLARRISPAMAVACRQIKEFNLMARQRGYLIE
jgi:competence protein ComFA